MLERLREAVTLHGDADMNTKIWVLTFRTVISHYRPTERNIVLGWILKAC